MRKKKRAQKEHKKKGMISQKGAIILGLLLVFALGLLALSFSLPQLSRGQSGKIIVVYPTPDPAKDNLQLETFGYITIIPTPTDVPSCPVDSVKPTGSSCKCIDNESVICPKSVTSCDVGGGFPWSTDECAWLQGSNGYNEFISNPSCSPACIGKPVIYLYPTKPMEVSVKLTIPGVVTKSDPVYPVGSGWENVLAHPDGTLQYQGGTYHELYYESQVNTKEVPPDGIIVPQKDLASTLLSVTGRLGLLPSEQQEFLTYWLPILERTKSPYILFSLLTPSQKEAVDHVAISPRPDTSIAFLAYFKPLKTPLPVAPLLLPTTPPKRVGFTSVEWGGTLDQE